MRNISIYFYFILFTLISVLRGYFFGFRGSNFGLWGVILAVGGLFMFFWGAEITSSRQRIYTGCIEKIHTLVSYRKNSHTFVVSKKFTHFYQNIYAGIYKIFAYLVRFVFVSNKFTHNFVTKKFTHFFVYSPVVFFSEPDFPKFNETQQVTAI